jgi:hypothetical protein
MSAVAAADLRAPGTGVADGHPGDRAAAAAPSAPLGSHDAIHLDAQAREQLFIDRLGEQQPFDPESVRRAFVSEPFPPGLWEERLDRAKSGGSYGPEAPYAPLGYEDDPEPIGPPLPGEPDMRPYRGIGPWWDTK